MPRELPTVRPTLREALVSLTLDSLRPLSQRISGNPPTRKADLVPFLVSEMQIDARVRAHYQELDPINQAAVQEAVANADGLLLSQLPWSLYLGEAYYGSLGYEGFHSWEILQGRFALAFLFEYAARLGLVDVAYASPVAARSDYTGQWGGDDLRFLSRYDGLNYFRLNRLGAWLLGRRESYEPEPEPARVLFKVLPNLELTVTAPALTPGDRMLVFRAEDEAAVRKAIRGLGSMKFR